MSHELASTMEVLVTDANLSDDNNLLILLLADKDLTAGAKLEIRSLDALDVVLFTLDAICPVIEKFHLSGALVTIGRNSIAKYI